MPDSLKFVEGQLFVLADKDFGVGEKIIILSTQDNLKLLSQASCWLMDGTFKVVPSIMRQLFTVHGKVQSEIVPLVIMSSKSKLAYDEFFYELCHICCEWQIDLSPKRIISDFEVASVASAKFFFPSVDFKGCLFHFGQIIWRRVQHERLASKYGINEEFSLSIRKLKSLAFVPEGDVLRYFTSLYTTFDADAKKIGTWFKKNYISGSTKNNKLRYSPSFWSISDSHKNSKQPRSMAS